MVDHSIHQNPTVLQSQSQILSLLGDYPQSLQAGYYLSLHYIFPRYVYTFIIMQIKSESSASLFQML